MAIFGYCDGVKGEDLYGWAWDPARPNEPIDVEILIDGALALETCATLYRPDLRAAGIGHGRYGWKMSLGLDPDRADPVDILVRARGGEEPLVDGRFTLDVDIPPSDRDNAEFNAFLASVTGAGPAFTPPPPAPPPPATFLLHCPVALDAATMGAAEYSYGFVMRAFAPLLAKLGTVVTIAEPDEADRIVAERLAAGESVTCFSFAPPQRTIMRLRCAVIPVIAWEFPTIPTLALDDDPRHDWRFVLRQCGRAITLSALAAGAIRATMGPDFPVAAVPAPVWDRFPELHDIPTAGGAARIEIDGFVYDTRGRAYSPTTPIPPLPADEYPREVEIDGVVFTSVFSPRDGRKNWLDIATAFCTAHHDTPDATLVFKMVGPDPAIWWWELHDVLNGLRPFACRLVVLHGYLADEAYNALVRASHWVVNASNAEGQCLPLLEYMSAGRPAVAPAHTAMADYIAPDNAIVVGSDEEDCAFPHDPSRDLLTTRHRIAWSSLADGLAEAYRVVREDPDRYARLSARARETMRAYCSDEVVAAKLDGWLGLNLGLAEPAPSPSALLRAIAAP